MQKNSVSVQACNSRVVFRWKKEEFSVLKSVFVEIYHFLSIKTKSCLESFHGPCNFSVPFSLECSFLTKEHIPQLKNIFPYSKHDEEGLTLSIKHIITDRSTNEVSGRNYMKNKQSRDRPVRWTDVR